MTGRRVQAAEAPLSRSKTEERSPTVAPGCGANCWCRDTPEKKAAREATKPRRLADAF